MDLSTIIGLVVGTILILLAFFGAAEDPSIYWNTPSVFIVLGGTGAGVAIGAPIVRLKGSFKVLRNAFFFQERSAVELIDSLVRYAEIARRDGILALEGHTSEIKDEFLVKGVQLAVDGTDPELIFQTMTTELEYLRERHGQGKKIFENCAKYSPAFGLIGTLIGLVAMLAKLDDPSQIGRGMAVALLTTMYGAILANLVFSPLTDKLDIRSKEECLLKEIVVRGVMSIQSGDNPRIVAQKLRIFLPPKVRAEAAKDK